jgi:hypothetical protein
MAESLSEQVLILGGKHVQVELFVVFCFLPLDY